MLNKRRLFLYPHSVIQSTTGFHVAVGPGGSSGAKIASTETGRGVVPPRAREGSLEFFICERVSTTSVVRNSRFLFTEGVQGGRRGHAHPHPGPRVRLHSGPNSGARAPLDPQRTLGPEPPVAASSGGRGVHPAGSLPLLPHRAGGVHHPLALRRSPGRPDGLPAPSISRPMVTPGGGRKDNRNLHSRNSYLNSWAPLGGAGRWGGGDEETVSGGSRRLKGFPEQH